MISIKSEVQKSKTGKISLLRFRTLIIIVTAVLALIVATPAIQTLVVRPQTDFFTEFWLLGSQHDAKSLPYNITSDQNYNIILGIGNQLGSCANYQIEVKFGNQTQSIDYISNQTQSSLPSLYNQTVFVANKETWEEKFNFSLDYTYQANISQVTLNQLMFNDLPLNLDGYSAALNSQNQTYDGTLFFELWIYNSSIHDFQYNQRLLYLNLDIQV